MPEAQPDYARAYVSLQRDLSRWDLTERQQRIALPILNYSLPWSRPSIIVPSRSWFARFCGNITDGNVRCILRELERLKIVRHLTRGREAIEFWIEPDVTQWGGRARVGADVILACERELLAVGCMTQLDLIEIEKSLQEAVRDLKLHQLSRLHHQKRRDLAPKSGRSAPTEHDNRSKLGRSAPTEHNDDSPAGGTTDAPAGTTDEPPKSLWQKVEDEMERSSGRPGQQTPGAGEPPQIGAQDDSVRNVTLRDRSRHVTSRDVRNVSEASAPNRGESDATRRQYLRDQILQLFGQSEFERFWRREIDEAADLDDLDQALGVYKDLCRTKGSPLKPGAALYGILKKQRGGAQSRP